MPASLPSSPSLGTNGHWLRSISSVSCSREESFMTVADVVYVVGVADRGLGSDLRLQLLEDVELALWLHYCYLQHTGEAGKP